MVNHPNRSSQFKSQREPEFHLQHFGPCEPHWPKGGWSIYQITGDEIAQRITFDITGKVVRRDSWCGYIGIFETLPEVMEAMQ
jgi:hypothetical protein